MKYAYTDGDFIYSPTPIHSEHVVGETFWLEPPTKGFIGRACFGVHDTPEEAKAAAIKALRARADHSKEIWERHESHVTALLGGVTDLKERPSRNP